VSKLSIMVMVKISQNCPPWKRITEGLNIEGYCPNSSCQSYNKGRVIFCWGFGNGGVFNFLQDKQFCKCPLCNRNFEPTNFGFLDTWYKVSGWKKTSSTEALNVSHEWEFAPNSSYTTFSGDNQISSDW
ncbi:2110_t:CDS:2, partial [Ambispora leptoticha]